MTFNDVGMLPECTSNTNCILVEWKFNDVSTNFKKLVGLASSLPRTETLELTDSYWHGLVRSLIFRFPDDLEILKVDRRNIIQVRSSSRVGISDLGVNKKRVDELYLELEKSSS